MGCKRGRRKPIITHHYDRNSIPEDLIIDQILPRLPIKSLARFKSVSKNWNSHISSNPFNPKTPSKIIIHPYSSGLPISIFTFVDQQLINKIHPYQITNPRSYYFTVIGSCNGLICLNVGCRAGDFFLICNPITQETRQFRGPLRDRYHYYYHGFAYDSSLNDYKLVLIGTSYQSAHLFSLKNSMWRKLQLPIKSHFANCMSSRSTLVGETLHWLRRDNSILAFDSVKESFFWVPLPPCPDLKKLLMGRDLFLCNIRDCLCVCSMRMRGSDNEPLSDAKFDFEVWILEEYGVWDSWKILFSLSYLQEFFKRKYDIYPNLFELRNHGNNYMDGNLLCILGSKEGLLMINSNGRFYHYHSIEMHGSPFVYAESLISPFYYYGRRQLNRKAKEGKKNYG